MLPHTDPWIGVGTSPRKATEFCLRKENRSGASARVKIQVNIASYFFLRKTSLTRSTTSKSIDSRSSTSELFGALAAQRLNRATSHWRQPDDISACEIQSFSPQVIEKLELLLFSQDTTLYTRYRVVILNSKGPTPESSP